MSEQRELLDIAERIINNDGRLSAGSSADLDYAQDQLDEWLAKVKAEAEVGILGDVIVTLTDNPDAFLLAPVIEALKNVIDHIRREAGIDG